MLGYQAVLLLAAVWAIVERTRGGRGAKARVARSGGSPRLAIPFPGPGYYSIFAADVMHFSLSP